MRNIVFFMENWKFLKKDAGAVQAEQTPGEMINLPHTWNAKDGQDGGNDYYRGTCWYVKEFDCPAHSQEEEVWLEFSGVAMRARVFLNGILLKSHDGGYSTFRVNMTENLQERNVVAVSVDNSENREVYPQKADFTFYGGIYRDVKLLVVPKAHFALGHHGGNGIKITPEIVDADGRAVSETQIEQAPASHYDADVSVELWTEQVPDGSMVELEILDADGNCAAAKKAVVERDHAVERLRLSDVRLWNGRKDPYLYTLRARLQVSGLHSVDSEDVIESTFGCRAFRIDPERGFFLNGESYPLCGAARHQDRLGVGNALTKEMHEEDMRLMLEMGANTVRMAHYQHDRYFYELADRYGMVVWAEIPYITEHMEGGRENRISQMVYCVGHYHAMCYSPFGFEDMGNPFTDTQSYLFGVDVEDPALKTPMNVEEYRWYSRTLQEMMPLLAEKYGTADLQAVSCERKEEDKMIFGTFGFQIALDSPVIARKDGVCLIVKESEDTFYLLLHAAAFAFFSTDADRPNVDVLSLEDGHFENGVWVAQRRLNGDEVADTVCQGHALLKIKLFAYL